MQSHEPLQLWLPVPAAIHHFPATRARFCCDGKVGRAMPFQGRKLHTLLSSRHGIKAAAEGRPCYLASWSCRGRGCLPCPASCQASPAPSLCPLPPHVWINETCSQDGDLHGVMVPHHETSLPGSHRHGTADLGPNPHQCPSEVLKISDKLNNVCRYGEGS